MIRNLFNDKDAQLHFLALLLIFAFAGMILVAAANSTLETQESIEEVDLCQDVSCEPTEIICPDGEIVSCSNSCDSESGECSSCTPSCEGHETPLEESGNLENVSLIESQETNSNGSIDSQIETNQNESQVNNNVSEPTNESLSLGLNESEIGETQSSSGSFESSSISPDLNIQISNSESVTRGELFEVIISISNNGGLAKDVLATLILPEGVSLVSEDETTSCGDIEENEVCEFSVYVESSTDIGLGENEIKIGVSYYE